MRAQRAVLVGPDTNGLSAALESRGVTVESVDGVPTGDALADAGLARADLFLLTDVEEATTIGVAREANPDVRVVVYTGETLPEYARPATDLTVDPALLDADTVAEELVAFDAAAD